MNASAEEEGAGAGAGDAGSAACASVEEDPRTAAVRYYCYGVALPAACALGLLGNALNLLVLTRRNMKGTAYVYMRGYAAASLLAIAFAVPFGVRVLVHREAGRWASRAQAFYHAHLELFLGNACLGVGVLMLLALTLERYVAVCHPARARPLVGPPRRVVALIPLATFAAYLPAAFRERLALCRLHGRLVYYKEANAALLASPWHAAYVVALEAAFKVGPTLLLAALNLRILLVYRRSCRRRRRRHAHALAHAHAHAHYAEERRLVLLLGSTSLLFLVCVSPMVILNVTLSERNLSMFSYQVFRAVANLLEVLNYSLTFYIYCLFSEDFRSTLLRTLRWPWPCCMGGGAGEGVEAGTATGGGLANKKIQEAKSTAAPTLGVATTTTATTATPVGVRTADGEAEGDVGGELVGNDNGEVDKFVTHGKEGDGVFEAGVLGKDNGDVGHNETRECRNGGKADPRICLCCVQREKPDVPLDAV